MEDLMESTLLPEAVSGATDIDTSGTPSTSKDVEFNESLDEAEPSTTGRRQVIQGENPIPLQAAMSAASTAQEEKDEEEEDRDEEMNSSEAVQTSSHMEQGRPDTFNSIYKQLLKDDDDVEFNESLDEAEPSTTGRRQVIQGENPIPLQAAMSAASTAQEEKDEEEEDRDEEMNSSEAVQTSSHMEQGRPDTFNSIYKQLLKDDDDVEFNESLDEAEPSTTGRRQVIQGENPIPLQAAMSAASTAQEEKDEEEEDRDEEMNSSEAVQTSSHMEQGRPDTFNSIYKQLLKDDDGWKDKY
ncbi:submandibular gland secretory Glx-rich protein CA-like [Pleurodeles waltl]|uniref:submandibular gland secretory Glx-rich protein CA-like n=1 Tax=Pleurodeles waltl TaxID=8319 RepID=UPI0037099058